MKYIDAENLKSTIEARVAAGLDGYGGNLKWLLELIDSLQQEQPSLPDNINKVAQKLEDYYDVGEEHGYLYCHRGDIKDAFIAGAEWMIEQIKEGKDNESTR